MDKVCEACGHEHQGVGLAYICIGCPCTEQPGKRASARAEPKPRAWSYEDLKAEFERRARRES